ncbi:SusC/RagA family TonB-linked outer membrane protein [Flavobacterium faecale]|uniref:SusC/RagA family TonB-linked outer membrane protein n=1 Tax=Flavobacterium faecale TaxID=1355330 RepID=UPI003AAA6FEC
MKKQRVVSGFALMLMLVLTSFSVLNAQDRISGTVRDAEGISLPGVNVKQVGTTNGVATDMDGKFAIILKPGQKKLEFSYLGFQSVTLGVVPGSNITVSLKESQNILEDVVVIGYQKFEREKVIGSTSSVKAESILQAAPVDVLQGVQGKVAGVLVTSNNGPGEGFDIRIRGVGTLNGSTSPLYVVDGQQTFNIDNLNPNDIENFEVLKDGASTAPYGAQGANGVVVITTVSGKKGKAKIAISSVTGMSSLLGQVTVATARQRVLQDRFLAPNGPTMVDSLSTGFRSNINTQELISRVALRNQINLAVSGGTDKATYNWSTGFQQQDGIVLNSDFRRVSTRLKVDVVPSKKVSLGTVVGLTFEETNGINSSQVLANAIGRIPYAAIFDNDGSILPTANAAGTGNPLQQLLFRRINSERYRINVFSYFQYNITPSLSFKSTLGINGDITKGEEFVPSILGNAGTGFTTATENLTFDNNIQQDNVFNFNKKFGKHSLGVFAGMQIQKGRIERIGFNTRLADDLIPTFNNANLDFLVPLNNTGNIDRSQFSLFSGFSYDFNSKYLVGATIRRDGSSKFGPDNRYGYFPSASVGWRVSKENFLKNVKTINDLKFRASYGIVGNDRINDFEFSDSYEPGAIYNGTTGYAPTTVGNPAIKWEETISTNLGFDLSMFKRRLNFTADVWQRETKDLLLNLQLPEESGFSTSRINAGSIRNRGIDLSIDGTVLKAKDFSLKAGFNIGFLKNVVTDLDTPIISGVSQIEEGQPIGNFRGYKNYGVFQWDESNAYLSNGERLNPNFDNNGLFLGSYTKANGQTYSQSADGDIRQLTYLGVPLKGGDYIWDDKDNNAKIDSDDIQILGNGLPTTYGGFTTDIKYKNWTMGVLFDYSLNNEIYRQYDHLRNSFSANTRTASPNRLEYRWTKQGDVTLYPKIGPASETVQNRFDYSTSTANSQYVEDGSFIRWRYIKLGYAFSKDALDSMKIGLTGFNLSLQANSLLTWTKYSGYNPEFGTRGSVLQPSVDNLRYPNSREVLLTINVQF